MQGVDLRLELVGLEHKVLGHLEDIDLGAQGLGGQAEVVIGGAQQQNGVAGGQEHPGDALMHRVGAGEVQHILGGQPAVL